MLRSRPGFTPRMTPTDIAGTQSNPMDKEVRMRPHTLDIFMEPRSVAVIGVTRKTGEGSFNVVENMLAFGYEGEIYPVNPMAETIAGLRAYSDVKEIARPPDLAVVSTPRETVPQVVADCASAGIKGAIVVPQGFADADETGKSLQEELSRIARETGIRILGPNTLGVSNAFSGFSSSFMPLQREKVPIGVICQSGVFFVGAPVFTGMMGKGIDIGNGCDVDFCDALAYFSEDDEVRVIFVHVEGMQQGRAFFETARNAAQKKPVIALKSARSQRGATAASSHSGALVGDHEIFEAAFRQAGLLSVQSPEEIMDYTRALLHLEPMKGKRIALITFTGAGAIMVIDCLEEEGLELSALSARTTQRIQELSPDWMPIQNPLDIWPALMKYGLHYVYATALRAVLEDPAVDGVICIALAPELPGKAYLDVTDVIRETATEYPAKPVVAWLYGPNQGEVSRRLEKGGHVLAFPTLSRAARTLSALNRRSAFLNRHPDEFPHFDAGKGVGDIVERCVRAGHRKIEGEEAQSVLEGYGIPVARSRLCRDLDQVIASADEIGYPVALKVVSPQITHKSDLGGVVLGLKNPGDLKAACIGMEKAIHGQVQDAKMEGFLLQEMAPSGVELILGAKRDPQFGPVILFGTGGIHAEVWRDISYALAPLSYRDAEAMIAETKVYDILKGARGKTYDQRLIRDSLLGLSQLMTDVTRIREIDINPFCSFSQGGMAVDSRIIVKVDPGGA